MSSRSTGSNDLNDPARKHAWLRVKSAIRAYSNDPTQRNAEEVEAAWHLMRRINTVAHWREVHASGLK